MRLQNLRHLLGQQTLAADAKRGPSIGGGDGCHVFLHVRAPFIGIGKCVQWNQKFELRMRQELREWRATSYGQRTVGPDDHRQARCSSQIFSHFESVIRIQARREPESSELASDHARTSRADKHYT